MSLPDLWFFLIAFFWAGYLVLEGFDFGVGMLLPVLGRADRDRDTMLEAIGPVWDGNEVWLIVAGGATFAAFPVWYAGLFSAAYVWLVLALLALILRAVSFEWGGKSAHRRWQGGWMWANAIGSLLVPFLWGVALSALLKGLPFDSKQDFTGSPLDFLSWYSVLGGVAFVGLCLAHGATFLSLKTAGGLADRARTLAGRLVPVAGLLALAYLVATVAVAHDGNARGILAGAIPAALAALSAVAAMAFTRARRDGWAFACTAATIALAVTTLFVCLYPRVLVSAPDFGNSLTVANASSSHYTLQVMTWVAVFVAPVVLLYQAWTYRIFRRRLET